MLTLTSRVRRHLMNPKSQYRRIFTGFLWVSLYVMVGKLAGAAKEVVMAWRYGVSATVDAYVFVFNLINLPVAVWFSVLTVVLVPLIARIRQKNNEELPRFRSELLGLTLITGFGLGFIAWLGLPILLQTEWVGLSGKVLAEALRISGGMSLLVPVGVVISLFSAWMMACGRHRNTLLEAVPALIILVALLIPKGWMPEPLLWGTVAGFTIHVIALGTSLHQQRELEKPSFRFSAPVWKGFWGSFGIMAVGQVLMSFTSLIDQFFAAGLGTGALSTLSYANRILAFILSIGAVAVSRATLPIFSEANARSGNDVNMLSIRWTRWMFYLGLVIAVFGWGCSSMIVELLFERGMFTADDTQSVSRILRIALIQIPFYFSSLVLVAHYASKNRYFSLLLLGGLGLFVKLVGLWFLVDLIGLLAVVLSNAIVYMFTVVVMIVCIGRK